MKNLLIIFIKVIDKLASLKKIKKQKNKNKKNNDPPDAIYPMW